MKPIQSSNPWSSSFQSLFVAVVLVVISTIYAAIMVTLLGTPWGSAFLLIFHFSLFLLLWCFIQAMRTDPGSVPSLWGLSLDNPLTSRKRYCLFCNVFKPERSHHCSICKKCVLGMDHHCPWVNNCIGFNNRKYFILLLIYALVCVNLVAFGLGKYVWDELNFTYTFRRVQDYQAGFVIGVYALNLSLSLLISFFFKFHVKLLLSNRTTLDTLDIDWKKKKCPYDQGFKNNFYQVFGKNAWLWLVPMRGDSGKAIGNGIHWDTIEMASSGGATNDNSLNIALCESKSESESEFSKTTSSPQG